MEDYLAAFLARALDTDALLKADRKVGVIHFGGITIECLIKAIIVNQTGISAWHSKKNPTSQGITNPGHELLEAIFKVPTLGLRLEVTPRIKAYIGILQEPPISNTKFIDLRYASSELKEEHFRKWLNAYLGVSEWLRKQKMHGSRSGGSV